VAHSSGIVSTRQSAAIRSDGTYQSIQALRGIAAILVTLVHAFERSLHSESAFRIGNAGVDIFFIISGFIMWTVTCRNPPSATSFLRHRLIRLVPLYYLFTFALLLAWLAIPKAFPNMAPPSFAHIMLSAAFIPHFDARGGGLPVLGQGWTLNFEMFFYLLFAIGLTLPRQQRFGFIAAVLLGLALLGLGHSEHMVQNFPPLQLLSPMLLEFLGGIAIGFWAENGWRPAKAWFWLLVGAGTFLLLLLPNPTIGDDWARALFFGGPAFLIVAGGVGIEIKSQKIKIGNLPLLLGAASYSLYLSHTFVISIVGKVLDGAPAWLAISIETILALAVAIGAYRWLEQPLQNILRGRKQFSWRPAAT
jgi:exopolysaccharide production protein ExoZ